MPSNYDNQLLREAILNIKAKEYEAARRYLERALELADDHDTRMQANFYLSQITDDPEQKREYLEETLAFDATHPEARRALAILDGKLKPEDIVDADHLPAQATETQQASADRFTCPKCGSRMAFDGNGRSLICESCAREETLNTTPAEHEQDFILAMATGQSQRKSVSLKTFQCQGCGAQFVLPQEGVSESCAYCDSVYVLAGTRELIEPDSVIPMAFDRYKAAQHMMKWVQEHKIISDAKIPAPRGLYLPVWTFDIMGVIPWRGTAIRNKQQVPVSGEKIASFDDIVILSTPKLADLLPKIIKSFSLGDAVTYDPRYLAGWPAEIYQTTMAKASLDARQQATERIRDSIYGEQGSVDNLKYSTANLSILSFKLVMIPIWISEYLLQGQPFRIIINGQTGSVYGETPSHGILGWLEDVFGA
jgi:hypothetical protein